MEQVKAALQKIHSQRCSNSVGVTFAMARLRSKCQMTARRSQVKAALYSIDRAGHRTRTKRAAKKTSYTYSVPGPRYVHVITCSVAARLAVAACLSAPQWQRALVAARLGGSAPWWQHALVAARLGRTAPRTWVCGRCGYVADMGMWRTCGCGGMWRTGMWRTWVCGGRGYVADVRMWRLCVCGGCGYVADVGMWRTWVCGGCGYVADGTLRDMKNMCSACKKEVVYKAEWGHSRPPVSNMHGILSKNLSELHHCPA
jgi:hypothetical protein